MASLNHSITVDVKVGPIFKDMIKCCEAAAEIAKLIPDANMEDRKRLHDLFVDMVAKFQKALKGIPDNG